MKFQEVLYSRHNTFIKAFCFNYFDRQIDVYITRNILSLGTGVCSAPCALVNFVNTRKQKEQLKGSMRKRKLFWGLVVVEYGRLTSVWSKGKKGREKNFHSYSRIQGLA